ncbi:MAG: carbon-nitrogen hydrolase family protein [Pseudomonadota bacterium]
MKPFRACVVQAGSTLFDTPATMAKLEALLGQAAAGDATFCVFPEAFIGGYPKGVHFGAPVGSRSPEGRDLFRRYFENAISVPGDETDRIAQLAKANGVNIVVGVIERASCDEGGGSLFCTALFFSNKGKLVGKRRKLMPTAAERVIWSQGDGSTLSAVDFDVARTGALICWENFMPMARMSQYAQGIEILCAPTVDDRDNWSALMRVAALEGRCFVLSANQYMRRDNAPADYRPIQGDAPDTVLINGGSMIVSPLGEVLAGPVFGEETLLFADLDPADIARGKMDFDVAGHYARADIFRLEIDKRSKYPVADKEAE